MAAIVGYWLRTMALGIRYYYLGSLHLVFTVFLFPVSKAQLKVLSSELKEGSIISSNNPT